jgi:hypothetical protein
MKKMELKRNRAVEGDEVWVILNHVKAKHWEEYKDFISKIFIPAAEKIEPSEMASTRFLYSDGPDENGIYTSVWLMDPVVQGGTYSIQNILKQAYGEEQGQEYFKMFNAEQVGFRVKQSPW